MQPVRRLLAAILLLTGLAACSADRPATPPPASPARSAPPVTTAPAMTRPGPLNIVFVLTDDLATNLVPFMPHVQALAARGTSFSQYTVTDSLCCPSRASIFTGKYPHNTGVFTNTGPDGGLPTFQRYGNEKSTFATDLQRAGYRTGFFGKYINGFQPSSKHVPPGWSTWAAGGDAYAGFNYNLLENKKIVAYGKKPADYVTDVLSAKANAFITASAKARKPFVAEVATYAPHLPYTPAPRDAKRFPEVKAPRDASFGKLPTNPTPWIAGHGPLTAADLASIDRDFRERVRAVQAVDRMVASLQATLERAGVADRTVVIFSSDNGLHMGEHGLMPGKQTPFDTDVRVPLIVAGPGIARGATVAEPVENIDLRPTFADLAGAPVPAGVDGVSLVPLLAGAPPADWREVALVEHHGPPRDPKDPDYQPWRNANPPDYRAIRTPGFTYIEYGDGTPEYYDNATDPAQAHNIAGTLSPERLARLRSVMAALGSCRGQQACQAAGQW